MATYLTGRHGFIGSRLAKFLIDITDDIKEADTVIHLGAYGNHNWQTDRKETFEANVAKTFRLLEKCKANKVKNFIFIGTSSEYGTIAKPMDEEDLPRAKSLYACTKVCGTYLTRYYSEYFNTATIRPFSVYGEQEDDRRFIPKIIRCLALNEKMILAKGDHDWIHVDDFCRGVLTVLENISKLNGQVVNIGTGESTSNIEVVKVLEQISGKALETEPVPRKKDDSFIWVANNTKIKNLGWSPKISLIEGLRKVYEFKTKSYRDK